MWETESGGSYGGRGDLSSIALQQRISSDSSACLMRYNACIAGLLESRAHADGGDGRRVDRHAQGKWFSRFSFKDAPDAWRRKGREKGTMERRQSKRVD